MKHWPLIFMGIVCTIMGYLNPEVSLSLLIPLALGTAVVAFTVLYAALLVIQKVLRIDLRLV